MQCFLFVVNGFTLQRLAEGQYGDTLLLGLVALSTSSCPPCQHRLPLAPPFLCMDLFEILYILFPRGQTGDIPTAGSCITAGGWK